jgi:hypothetical protein
VREWEAEKQGDGRSKKSPGDVWREQTLTELESETWPNIGRRVEVEA